ncbi:MAG TPA: tRNA uracil 4-sulfurtransferase ThiI [Thermodesulfobacteriota bacterium]|nr:tRNA uracil 4-sulfurtransferase ThiI [Thermodesulfobacteriota bacterium]
MKDTKYTLIHYGELSLKGRNRAGFEIKLKENIEAITSGSVKRFRGYFVMKGGNPSLLTRIPGISWYAETIVADNELGQILVTVTDSIRSMRLQEAPTFGVFVKRPDKRFPYSSMEVASIVGDRIGKEFGYRANLRTPELKVFIEIADRAYIFFEKKEGMRGFPTDVSGRVMSLISGGIDSPVSSYLMMKRGCRVDLLHFHVYADNESVRNTKMTGIFRRLNEFQPGTRIFLFPYYPFETAVLKLDDIAGFELVLFRRFMARVAEKIAVRHGSLALVTGDSLGQVASQTIENMALVKEAVSLPIFQPLITYDKQEIIDLARKIGTYELSIEGYKDCCSIVSANPKTRARRDRVLDLERRMNMDELIEETLSLVGFYEM